MPGAPAPPRRRLETDGYAGFAVADLASELHPFAESLLEPGEELLGACVASQQRRFKGWMVAVAVTPERIVIQRMAKGREFKADGEPMSLRREDIASARAGGAGTWGASPTSEIMERTTIDLKIRTTAGEKLRLMMMRGEGKVFGNLGGGEIQSAGVQALAEWFERNAA